MLHLRLRPLLLLLFLFLANLLALPTATPAPAQPTGDFVKVQGNQLVYKGQPVKLKGFNFYPKDYPWADMWLLWNGPAAHADLARAKEVGANTVRIMVPYLPKHGWTDRDTGRLTPGYLDHLRQMVQIAGDLDMKVIITLFDFYDPKEDNPLPGSSAEARNKLYLQSIVPAFRDDDRVLAWDLHNEPDHYETWNERREPATMIEWMGRMAAEIRRLDPNHLLTVGIGQYDNLFVSDATGAPPLGQRARGLTPADLSDFLSFHSYNAGSIDWQIHYVQQQGGGKPVVLGETGWPTGPPCQQPEYGFGPQVGLYDLMMKGARKADLSGVLIWQLWDLQPGKSYGGGRESHEDYYGLLRRDGTWKPAMPLFRDGWPGPDPQVAAPPLPSRTRTDLPLTVRTRPPAPPDPRVPPPIFFPETGFSVHNEFRAYWVRFGGLPIFGYPITQARKEGDYWVQYFERARFEFHPENSKAPNWDRLSGDHRLKLVVQLSLLGVDLVKQKTGGKGFPRIAPEQAPPGAVYFPETGHSLSGRLLEYWQANNGLTNFGYPLSEPLQERSQADGKLYTVQYFERTRLELHPENAGTPYEVLLGLLGRELLAGKGCK